MPAGDHRPPGRLRSSRTGGGFITLEVVGSLALTGILLALMTGLIVSYRQATDYQLSHHQAQLAAESYLDHLRAGRVPPENTEAVTYKVDRQPGQGDWAGLTRYVVKATVATRSNRTASCTVTTYVAEASP